VVATGALTGPENVSSNGDPRKKKNTFICLWANKVTGAVANGSLPWLE
jgi:hypothetical protein